jgi:hypothetical protein
VSGSSAMTARAGNRRLAVLKKPCAPTQKRHTKSIYCGKRKGRLNTPRGSGQRQKQMVRKLKTLLA